jgi:hypothetical protein
VKLCSCRYALDPRLIELDVTEPSMSAPSIPRAKKIFCEL